MNAWKDIKETSRKKKKIPECIRKGKEYFVDKLNEEKQEDLNGYENHDVKIKFEYFEN